MSDTVNAVVTRPRGITHNKAHLPQGGIIENMALDQFAEWNRLEIVERATDEQVAGHREAVAQAEAEAAALDAEEKAAAVVKPSPKPAAKKAAPAKKATKSRPSRAKKPAPEAPVEAASPLAAPVLGTVTTEPEATDAPDASA